MVTSWDRLALANVLALSCSGTDAELYPRATRCSFNALLDYPRTESGTTGLWNFYRPIHLERSLRGWRVAQQNRWRAEHPLGCVA